MWRNGRPLQAGWGQSGWRVDCLLEPEMAYEHGEKRLPLTAGQRTLALPIH